MSADRNLLFGILAIQNNFITRDQLVEAMHSWTLARHRPLGELLRERGALSEQKHALLDALVTMQLDQHQGDAVRSLRALEVSPSALRTLAAVSDAALHASLGHLATPSLEATTDYVARLGPVGQRYRILRPHARGGLGEVFVAEDTELHREVALKEIQQEHAADAGSRGRFLLEAEITGRLEHPGIIPVYGLGCYADGRPFYAMRLIRGDNLKHAIDRFHASRAGFDSVAFRQVLRRFLDVCNAVAYAHARGVLHRDLKPGNVMLGEFGETLLVDWGLAKVVGRAGSRQHPEGDPGEPTLRLSSGGGVAETVAGAVVGTPSYMSPEQAEGKLDALGPATDVYSLGATLYCVLTGRPPVPGDEVAEVLEKVRRGDVAPAEGVRADVPGALAAVCRKAMALRPGDRYPSALVLAQDVERWLADEPVSTYRDPVWVRTGRWARRNRTLVAGTVAAGVVTLLALAVGLAVVGGLNRRLGAANADLSRSNARLAAARAAADRERAVAVAVSDFLEKDLLGQADIANQPRPGEEAERDPDIKVAELLDRASDAIEGKFQGQPQTEGTIRLTIGNVYQALGHYEAAQRHLERSLALLQEKLGAHHPHTVASMGSLAWLYKAQGKYDQAEPLLVEAVRRSENKLGADHPVTLASKSHLALLYQAQNEHDKAQPLLLEVLRRSEMMLGADHRDALASKTNLAGMYHVRPEYDKAERLYLEVIQQWEKKQGADHPHTLQSKNNLAAVYVDQRKYDRAEPLLLEVIRQWEKKRGADHPDTLTSKDNLADMYMKQGKDDRAEPLLADVLRRSETKLGADHPATLRCKRSLGVLYREQGKYDRAEPLLLEAARRWEKKRGADHRRTLEAKNSLGVLYWSMGKLDRSIPLFQQVLQQTEKLGADDPLMLLALANLGVNYRDAGRPDDGIRCLEDALTRARKRPGGLPADMAWVPGRLLESYELAKRYAKAEPFYRAAVEQAREQHSPDDARTASAVAQLGLNLLQQKRHADAEGLLRDCLRVREKAQPEDWTTFHARSLLGEALLGQKKHAEAGPLLVQGCEGMKKREAKIPAPFRTVRLKEALERVVTLYDAEGKKDEAAKYRKELDALMSAAEAPPKK